jgi:hypothetical protein
MGDFDDRGGATAPGGGGGGGGGGAAVAALERRLVQLEDLARWRATLDIAASVRARCAAMLARAQADTAAAGGGGGGSQALAALAERLARATATMEATRDGGGNAGGGGDEAKPPVARVGSLEAGTRSLDLGEDALAVPTRPEERTTLAAAVMEARALESGGRAPVTRHVRIYLCTNWSDFDAEREAVAAHVTPMLERLGARLGVFVSVVDPKRGLTLATSEDPALVARCLDEIDACRPYFVALLSGERYGQAPASIDPALERALPWLRRDNDPLDDGSAAGLSRRSLAEIEIEHAALRHARIARRCYFYTRSPFHLSTVPGPEQHKFESEGPRAKARLESLKTRIAEAGFPIRANYPSIGNLCEQLLADLTAAIEHDLAEIDGGGGGVGVGSGSGVDGSASGGNGLEAPASGSSSATAKTVSDERKLTALHRDLAVTVGAVPSRVPREMNQSIRAHVSERLREPLVISGGDGCGKSTAVMRFRREWELAHGSKGAVGSSSSGGGISGGGGGPDDAAAAAAATDALDTGPVVFVHTVSPCIPRSDDPVRMLLRLMAVIKEHFALPNDLPEDPADVYATLYAWLDLAASCNRARAAAAGGGAARGKAPPPVLVIIDGVDLLRAPPHQPPPSPPLLWLPETLPEGVVGLFTCGNDSPTHVELRRRRCPEIRATGIGTMEVRAIAAHWLDPEEGLAAALTPLVVRRTAVDGNGGPGGGAAAPIAADHHSPQSDASIARVIEVLLTSRACANPTFLRTLLMELTDGGDASGSADLGRRAHDLVQLRDTDDLARAVLERIRCAGGAGGVTDRPGSAGPGVAAGAVTAADGQHVDPGLASVGVDATAVMTPGTLAIELLALLERSRSGLAEVELRRIVDPHAAAAPTAASAALFFAATRLITPLVVCVGGVLTLPALWRRAIRALRATALGVGADEMAAAIAGGDPVATNTNTGSGSGSGSGSGNLGIDADAAGSGSGSGPGPGPVSGTSSATALTGEPAPDVPVTALTPGDQHLHARIAAMFARCPPAPQRVPYELPHQLLACGQLDALRRALADVANGLLLHLSAGECRGDLPRYWAAVTARYDGRGRVTTAGAMREAFERFRPVELEVGIRVRQPHGGAHTAESAPLLLQQRSGGGKHAGGPLGPQQPYEHATRPRPTPLGHAELMRAQRARGRDPMQLAPGQSAFASALGPDALVLAVRLTNTDIDGVLDASRGRGDGLPSKEELRALATLSSGATLSAAVSLGHLLLRLGHLRDAEWFLTRGLLVTREHRARLAIVRNNDDVDVDAERDDAAEEEGHIDDGVLLGYKRDPRDEDDGGGSGDEDSDDGGYTSRRPAVSAAEAAAAAAAEAAAYGRRPELFDYASDNDDGGAAEDDDEDLDTDEEDARRVRREERRQDPSVAAAVRADHEMYMDVVTQLANMCTRLGRLKEAEVYLRRACRSAIQFGEGQAAPLLNLARFYAESLSDPRRALPLATRAHTLLTALHGPRHPLTLDAVDTLAQLLQSLGQARRAYVLLFLLLLNRKEALGEYHPLTLMARRRLARALERAHTSRSAATAAVTSAASAVTVPTTKPGRRDHEAAGDGGDGVGVGGSPAAASAAAAAASAATVNLAHAALQCWDRCVGVTLTQYGENHPEHAASLGGAGACEARCAESRIGAGSKWSLARADERLTRALEIFSTVAAAAGDGDGVALGALPIEAVETLIGLGSVKLRLAREAIEVAHQSSGAHLGLAHHHSGDGGGEDADGHRHGRTTENLGAQRLLPKSAHALLAAGFAFATAAKQVLVARGDGVLDVRYHDAHALTVSLAELVHVPEASVVVEPTLVAAALRGVQQVEAPGAATAADRGSSSLGATTGSFGAAAAAGDTPGSGSSTMTTVSIRGADGDVVQIAEPLVLHLTHLCHLRTLLVRRHPLLVSAMIAAGDDALRWGALDVARTAFVEVSRTVLRRMRAVGDTAVAESMGANLLSFAGEGFDYGRDEEEEDEREVGEGLTDVEAEMDKDVAASIDPFADPRIRLAESRRAAQASTGRRRRRRRRDGTGNANDYGDDRYDDVDDDDDDSDNDSEANGDGDDDDEEDEETLAIANMTDEDFAERLALRRRAWARRTRRRLERDRSERLVTAEELVKKLIKVRMRLADVSRQMADPQTAVELLESVVEMQVMVCPAPEDDTPKAGGRRGGRDLGARGGGRGAGVEIADPVDAAGAGAGAGAADAAVEVPSGAGDPFAEANASHPELAAESASVGLFVSPRILDGLENASDDNVADLIAGIDVGRALADGVAEGMKAYTISVDNGVDNDDAAAAPVHVVKQDIAARPRFLLQVALADAMTARGATTRAGAVLRAACASARTAAARVVGGTWFTAPGSAGAYIAGDKVLPHDVRRALAAEAAAAEEAATAAAAAAAAAAASASAGGDGASLDPADHRAARRASKKLSNLSASASADVHDRKRGKGRDRDRDRDRDSDSGDEAEPLISPETVSRAVRLWWDYGKGRDVAREVWTARNGGPILGATHDLEQVLRDYCTVRLRLARWHARAGHWSTARKIAVSLLAEACTGPHGCPAEHAAALKPTWRTVYAAVVSCPLAWVHLQLGETKEALQVVREAIARLDAFEGVATAPEEKQSKQPKQQQPKQQPQVAVDQDPAVAGEYPETAFVTVPTTALERHRARIELMVIASLALAETTDFEDALAWSTAAVDRARAMRGYIFDPVPPVEAAGSSMTTAGAAGVAGAAHSAGAQGSSSGGPAAAAGGDQHPFPLVADPEADEDYDDGLLPSPVQAVDHRMLLAAALGAHAGALGGTGDDAGAEEAHADALWLRSYPHRDRLTARRRAIALAQLREGRRRQLRTRTRIEHGVDPEDADDGGVFAMAPRDGDDGNGSNGNGDANAGTTSVSKGSASHGARSSRRDDDGKKRSSKRSSSRSNKKRDKSGKSSKSSKRHRSKSKRGDSDSEDDSDGSDAEDEAALALKDALEAVMDLEDHELGIEDFDLDDITVRRALAMLAERDEDGAAAEQPPTYLAILDGTGLGGQDDDADGDGEGEGVGDGEGEGERDPLLPSANPRRPLHVSLSYPICTQAAMLMDSLKTGTCDDVGGLLFLG